jgi:hypothetical protein
MSYMISVERIMTAYAVSSGGVTEYDEMQRVFKEVVMPHFKVLGG